VKNRGKAAGIDDKIDVIRWLEKGERIVDICRNIIFAQSSARTIRDNADRIKERAKSVTEVFV
jgi:CENP-B N-terminal DNA-binding domain.